MQVTVKNRFVVFDHFSTFFFIECHNKFLNLIVIMFDLLMYWIGNFHPIEI